MLGLPAKWQICVRYSPAFVHEGIEPTRPVKDQGSYRSHVDPEKGSSNIAGAVSHHRAPISDRGYRVGGTCVLQGADIIHSVSDPPAFEGDQSIEGLGSLGSVAMP
jgi:hypothetical protein